MEPRKEELFTRRISREEIKAFPQGLSPAARQSCLQSQRETMICCKFSDKMKAYKNLLAVSIGCIMIYAPFYLLLGLQSTVNAEDGLGLTSNAIIFVTLAIVSIVGSSIVELIGTKYALISGYVLLLMYIILNYYPTWYTLVPASILNGLSLSATWTNVYAHAISVAVLYATALKETKEHAMTLFSAVVTASIRFSAVLGGVATSLILINLNSNVTIDRNSTETCTHEETASLNTDDDLYYILTSCYALMDIVAIIISLFFMDHLGSVRPFMSPRKILKLYLTNLLQPVLKTLLDWKFLSVASMMILDGLLQGFQLGTISKVLVSDCIGVKWIGFTLACTGFVSTITAVTVGSIQRFIPQYIIVYVSLSGVLGLSLFLLLFERQASFIMIFLYVIGWGIFGASLSTVPPAMLGMLFPKKKESALSLLPGSIGIGYFLAFIGGIYLSYITQLWIICGLILLITVTYSAVFFANATKEQLVPCFFKEPEQGDIEEVYEEYIFVYRTDAFNPLSARPSITVENGIDIVNMVSLKKETPV